MLHIYDLGWGTLSNCYRNRGGWKGGNWRLSEAMPPRASATVMRRGFPNKARGLMHDGTFRHMGDIMYILQYIQNTNSPCITGKAHVLPSWVPILANLNPLFSVPSTTL